MLVFNYSYRFCGREGIRTLDLCSAIATLSQLSYTPDSRAHCISQRDQRQGQASTHQNKRIKVREGAISEHGRASRPAPTRPPQGGSSTTHARILDNRFAGRIQAVAEGE